ncbi:peptidase domain-containing ABC transporter [Algoriphagus sediminis]|uniref:ABC transporter ATP-binding protein n=1 Tax=Algoriphagus sediminis TaxID=3057113 RepID=A0ABT7YDC6_9BACT|nr:ABC transporter ATP-binding protein [Algoriphagus sediminis]MDN3204511.1 ABC transporter ATP-binding protein [Algoriphagus sediminis]
MNSQAGITPVKRFFNLLDEERGQVYSIYFYAILNGLVTLSLPLGIQAILNFILGGRITTSWIILVVVVALGVAFGGFLQISQMQISEKLQQRIFTKSGLAIAYRLPRVKTEVMHGEYGPEVVNRFFDTVNLQKGLSKILLDFSTALLQMIFGLLLLSFYHPTFILFGLVLLGLLALIFYFTSDKGMETALKESSYKYKTAYWLEEVGRTLNTFKLVGNTRLPILRADKILQKYVEFRSKHFAVLIFQYKIMIVFKVLIVTSLLLAGSFLLINEQISIGQFVAAEVIIILVVNSVEKLILSLETVYDTLVAVEKLGHVMDLDLERSHENDKTLAKEDGLKFSMDNVTFHPQDKAEPVLKRNSLSVEAGKKVVITGKSGSGKTAVLALLSGLYEEYEGKISINDLSLEMVNLERLRDNVGACLDLEQIFHGTIKENILVGRDFDQEKLDQILEMVELKNEIFQLPDDLDTIIQPEGKGLSKSFAQGILLARGFVGDTKAILMENVLRNTDKEIKTKVLDYLFEGNWTLMLIVELEEEGIMKRADEIILMDNGRAIFQGTYEEYLNFNSKS